MVALATVGRQRTPAARDVRRESGAAGDRSLERLRLSVAQGFSPAVRSPEGLRHYNHHRNGLISAIDRAALARPLRRRVAIEVVLPRLLRLVRRPEAFDRERAVEPRLDERRIGG